MNLAERNFVKKSKKLDKKLTGISSLTMSSEDFFFEFYYPNEIVTENEGKVDVLLI